MKDRNTKIKQAAQAGFTIVELMIATLVFSTILLVITFGVIHFTSDYYKGVNSSTTQDTARNIMNIMSQAIQFSGDTPLNPTPSSVCIGNQQLVYTLGNEILTASDNGLAQITDTSCDSAAVASSGTELLDTRMRLVQFSVTEPMSGGVPVFSDHSVWKVTVSIAYGDNDLLCDSSVAASATGGCSSHANPIADPNTATAASNGTLHCKSMTGSQFCDVVTLSTTVTRRIVGAG